MIERLYLGILLFCYLHKSCLSQDPKVRIQTTVPATVERNKIVVERDIDLTMNCHVENLYADMSVRWQREYLNPYTGVMTTQPISQDMALDDNIRFGIEKPSEYVWSLRVRGIQVTDNGRYICFVQLTQIIRAQDFRDVQVIVKPFLEPQNISPNMMANQGDNLQLTCNSTGLPMPNVIWSRLGGQLLSIGQEKYEGAILPLRDIQASDRGTYICTATNDYGTKVHQIEVDVRFKPIIKVGQAVVEQAPGYRIELQCFIESNPIPDVKVSAWAKGTTLYTQSSDRFEVKWLEGAFSRMNYELIIKDVQPEDYGVYTCRVSNEDVSKGLTVASITLQRSDVPKPSVKLGRIIRASENPEDSSSVPIRGMMLLSVVAMVIAMIMIC